MHKIDENKRFLFQNLMGRPRCREENNIKNDLKKTGWEVVDWSKLAWDSVQWRALLITTADSRDVKKA
jgi:hypothetical protein